MNRKLFVSSITFLLSFIVLTTSCFASEKDTINQVETLIDNKKCKQAETLLSSLKPTMQNHISITMGSIGDCYKDEKKWADAERAYTKSLDMAKQAWGANNENAVGEYITLGVFLCERGKFNKGLPLVKRALSITQVQKGIDKEKAAERKVWMKSPHKTDAYIAKRFDSIMNSLNKLTGDKSAKPLNALGYCYDLKGQTKLADTNYIKAIKANPAESTYLENNASTVNWKEHNPKKSALMYERALKLRKMAIGENHLEYLIRLNYLANVYRNAGRNKDADLLCDCIVQGLIKNPNSKYLKKNVRDYVKLLRKNNQNAKAESILRKVKLSM